MTFRFCLEPLPATHTEAPEQSIIRVAGMEFGTVLGLGARGGAREPNTPDQLNAEIAKLICAQT